MNMKHASLKGFTLVETMVAIAILTLSIVGPMYVIQQGVVGSYTARDRLIASGLAQEGVEFTHSLRDSNYLYNIAHPSAPRSWFYGMDGTNSTVDCTTGASCAIDVYYNTVTLCTGTCAPLRLSSTGLYNQNPVSATNAVTRFTRSLKLTRVNDHEMMISVVVTWTTGRKTYNFTVSEDLQNWL